MSTSTAPVIDIKDLHVSYTTLAGKRIHAVRGLSMSVHPGEVVGFIGPNGAGKSTTIKALLGFQRAQSGSISLFGYGAGDVRARRRIGYLPEVALYYPFLTARETLHLYATLAEIPKAARATVVADLLGKVNLAQRADEPVRGFSKGMLQRVGIAQAIMGDPDLLILDEVTSGLDPVARYDVRKILLSFKARGKTVFFSSHELSEVTALCDRVIMIDEGKVFRASGMEALLSDIERTVITAEGHAVFDELPEGGALRSVHDGVHTFIAESPEAQAALERQLTAAGLRITATEREPGSLEDFFVRSIGHKVS
jgi:ABC-2 type transport system ATP-binding protein